MTDLSDPVWMLWDGPLPHSDTWYQWCRSSHGWGHTLTQEYDNLICGTDTSDFNSVFVVGDATYQGQCTSEKTMYNHGSYADCIKKNLPADIQSTEEIYNSLRCTEVMEFEKKLNETLNETHLAMADTYTIYLLSCMAIYLLEWRTF